MSRRGSIVGDSVWSTVGVLAQGLSRFAYTVLVGRMLGADALSDVNVAFAVAILLSLLWPTGAGNAAAVFLGGGGQAVLRRLTRSVLIAALPLAAAAVIVAALLGADAVSAIAVAVLTLAWSGYIFGRGVCFGTGHVLRAARWDIATALVSLGLLAVVLLLRVDALVLVPAIVGYAVFAGRALIGTPPPRTTAPATTAHLRAFIAWSSLTLIATNGLLQLSMVVAYGFDTTARSGQFAAALALATPVSMLAQAVTQALLPRFGEWSSLERDARLAAVRRTLAAMGAIMFVGCAAIAVAVIWFLPLLFGAGFAPAVPIAQALMIAVFGFSLSVLLAAYLSATGRARLATVLAGASSVAGLTVMMVVAITVDGVTGATWGAAVGMLLAAAAMTVPAVTDVGKRAGRAPSAMIAEARTAVTEQDDDNRRR